MGLVNVNCLVLDPMKQLRCFEDKRFESMVEDWQRCYLGTKYQRVERLGSANDKGRDIACTGLNKELYIFQCKNYNKQLGFPEVLPEIGKCCYHCFSGAYAIPKEYHFVSPLGVAPKAGDVLKKPEELRKLLKEKWDKMCASKIRSPPAMLTPDLETFIDLKMDFSIFDYVIPKDFIAEFSKTNHFAEYFNLLLKARPLVRIPPEEITVDEARYISKLLAAYSDYLKQNIEDKKKLEQTNKELYEDFKNQREYFYFADSLAEFSRDVYSKEDPWFENLKTEFYHGIIQDIREDAQHGFERLNKVLKRAMGLPIGSGRLLTSEIKIQDRKGICHHLANDSKRNDVVWVK